MFNGHVYQMNIVRNCSYEHNLTNYVTGFEEFMYIQNELINRVVDLLVVI